MGHSRKGHTDSYRNHTTTQPDNQQTPHILQIMINHSHPDYSSTRIHQNTHAENPTINKNCDQINKKSIQKDQQHLVHTKYQRIPQQSKASGNYSDRYNQPYQSYNPYSKQTIIINKKVQAHNNLMTDLTDRTSRTCPGPTRNNTTKETSR